MILSVQSLREAVGRRETFRYRFFWGHRPRPDGVVSDSCFSQWWAQPFEHESERYATAEHFMMASKARLFGDDDARAKILATTDPAIAKKLGRGVKGFDEARWAAARFDLVTRGNLAKFGQHADLRDHLFATRDDVLVEASPMDSIWGIALAADAPDARDPTRWRGLNLLGFALMRARSILAGETTF